MTRSQNHGIVLAGGGAYGAYELGVLKAMIQGKTQAGSGRRVKPGVITGTSIGSFNAAFLAARWEDAGIGAVHELEDLWQRRLAQKHGRNGAYRIRLNPFEMLDPRRLLEPLATAKQLMGDTMYLSAKGLGRTTDLFSTSRPMTERMMGLFNLSDFISVEPWQNLLNSSIDYPSLQRSGVALRVTATNWENGELTIFKNSDMTPIKGPKVIRASSALPGIFPVAILDANRFVDGAVLSNTPLKPAIRAGADVLHVINLYALLTARPLTTPENTVETMFRQQLIEWAAMLKRDLDRVSTYNRERCGPGAGKPRHEDGKPYRPLTVHIHAPAQPLGGPLDMLNLNPSRIRELIELGYLDGEAHNCQSAGCITPDV